MRDDFTNRVRQTLAARAGHRCSRPHCRAATSGPRTDPSKAVDVGVAAHITAASPQGPRYRPDLSTEQRTSVENAIWLCQTCAKLVDNDDERFTPDVLRSWKAAAEVCAADVVGTPDPSEAAREARSKLRATFEPALIELESAKVDTHYILSKQRASHDQALGIYRRHVPEDLRDSYEKAIGTFQSVRQNVQPAMISFLQQQVGERPSGSTREEVMASIEAILAFAS
jgi:hypothetical protein